MATEAASGQSGDQRKLDFSVLKKLVSNGKAGAETPGASRTGERVYDSIAKQESPPQTAPEPQKQEKSATLYRDVQKEKELDEMSGRICREYQANVRASDDLQSQILKGIKAGEDSYHLFLKAARAISLMTSNPQFYNQVERDYRHLYGEIWGEKEPLEDMLQETRDRLEKLRSAAQEEKDIDAHDRLNRSITAHEERIRELEEKISLAH